jgi:hypothetical protein
MSYTAKNLEDVAASFDHRAWQASAFSDRLHKTQRDKTLAERESRTWKTAAQVLRETTLDDGLTATDWRDIQDAVSNSALDDERRIRLLDMIGAKV